MVSERGGKGAGWKPSDWDLTSSHSLLRVGVDMVETKSVKVGELIERIWEANINEKAIELKGGATRWGAVLRHKLKLAWGERRNQ